MGVQDRLEGVLRQIPQAALEEYERYLTRIPDKDRHPDFWAKERQVLVAAVDDLCARFREFYALDSHDFAANVAQLSAPLSEEEKHPLEGRPLVTRPMGGTAFASIFSAEDNYMRPVGAMIHADLWRGVAATRFRDNFLVPFGAAAAWQRGYIRELAVAAQTYRDTVDGAANAIMFVAESCLGAFRGHPRYQTADATATDHFSAASLLLGALGLFLPASTPALVVGVGSVASGIASAVTAGSDKRPYLQVDYSEYPHTIIKNTEYAIKQVEETILDVDETLALGLDKDLYSTDAFASPHLKLPPPGVDSSTFGYLDILDRDGKPPNRVVVAIVELYKAGYYNLPAAAYEYNAAMGQIDGCRVPGGMGRYFPRSISVFNSACTRLSGILRQTTDDLSSAGETILTAARTFQGTDEEQAEILRQAGQIPPHHSTAPVH